MKKCNDSRGVDKWLHGALEMIIAMITAGFLLPVLQVWLAITITLGVAMSIGVLKELRDMQCQGNHFCVWDLLWDAAGALSGVLAQTAIWFYTWPY